MLTRGQLRCPYFETVANYYAIPGYCSQEAREAHSICPIANLLENTLGGVEREGASSWKPEIRVLVMCNVGRHSTARRLTGQLGASPGHLSVTHLPDRIPTKRARTTACVSNKVFLHKASPTAA